jgi:hypothetical protein
MKQGSRRRPQSLAKTATELAVAVPQVVGHRLRRMAKAGPVLSPADSTEFIGMVAEKPMAFMQAWTAMGAEMLRLQTRFVMAGWSMLGAWGSPGRWLGVASREGRQVPGAWAAVLHQGLKPVHRKAVANARRLNKRG